MVGKTSEICTLCVLVSSQITLEVDLMIRKEQGLKLPGGSQKMWVVLDVCERL